ncbi:MAG: hypothetical protein P8X60_02795 [Robiginitalea sp.]
MGKKKDKYAGKQSKKREKRLLKLAEIQCTPGGCKSKCCEKYRKCEGKRCKKCPCFDLLEELRRQSKLQQVA